LSATSVYIIEEHSPVRKALAERLAAAAQIDVVGRSAEVENSVDDILSKKPDVVLLEVKRSDGMGFELLRRLQDIDGRMRVIVLTSYVSDWEKEAASRVGAEAYVLKDIDAEELIDLLVQSE
jgi:DNA-binding NarL/FixJ family response regulator